MRGFRGDSQSRKLLTGRSLSKRSLRCRPRRCIELNKIRELCVWRWPVAANRCAGVLNGRSDVTTGVEARASGRPAGARRWARATRFGSDASHGHDEKCGDHDHQRRHQQREPPMETPRFTKAGRHSDRRCCQEQQSCDTHGRTLCRPRMPDPCGCQLDLAPRGHRVVVAEFQRVAAFPCRQRLEPYRVVCQFGERHLGGER